ncbi:ABC transporter substrate-binding protein [Nocardioides sp.]|uniref:ABC transporter substrate-binding protein n=1 Tax=Nocardioides sp. TaxID=35761 RepID=UPI0039E35635
MRRHGVVTRVGGVSASLLLVVAAATACSSDKSSDSDSSESSTIELQNTTAAATGEMDVLKWGVPFGEPTTLDTAKGGDNSLYLVNSNICDRVVALNPDYSLGPSLATSWTYSEDHLSLVFTLRDDVKFSNGEAMTAEDVQYSLARHMDPTVASGYAGSVFASVASIDVTGTNEVTVTFKTPDSLFLTAMSVAPGVVMQKSFVEAHGTETGSPSVGVMCTGPYQIENWASGSGIQLTENPYYWNTEAKPHAKEVDLQFISDASALTQALQSGAIDGSYEVPPAAIEPLSETDGQLIYGPNQSMLQIFPVGTGAMQDERLRQAFSKLVDRTAIAEKVFHGAATPLYTMVPEVLWGPDNADLYTSGLEELDVDKTADIEGAKKLIAEMDDPPTSLTMVVIAGNEQMRLTSTLLQEQAKQLGIDLEIKQIQPAENASYFIDPAAREGVDLIMNTGVSVVPDILFYPRRTATDGALFNLAQFSDPEVDAAVAKAVETFDSRERAEILKEAQPLYEPARITVPLVNSYEILYLRKGLTGGIASFAYVFSPSLALIGPSE